MAVATARRPSAPALPRVARRTIAEAAIAVQVVLGTWFVLASAERPSLLATPHHGRWTAWFAGPLRGLLPDLSRSPGQIHHDMRVGLLWMTAVWLLVVLSGNSARGVVVVGAIVILHGLFLLAPPFHLTDLFNYLGYARLPHPYTQLPLAGHADPVFAYSNWHRLRSPYGPLFTLILLPTAKVPLAVAYWSYKALVTVASLGMLAAIWGAARRLGRDPVPAVAFVGLNPIVLVYALGGKHNDLLMTAALMGGVLLLLERRELLGGAALAAAIAIKASAGLLAPIVALAAPRRPRAFAGLAAGSLVLALVSLAVFGAHLPDLRDQDKLVGVYSVPNLLGYAAGHGGADAAVRRAATVLLLGGLVACAYAAWRTRSLAPAGWAALLAVLTAAWLMPWYVLWALPFAALARSRRLRAATVLVAVWVALVWTGVVPQLYHEHGIYVSRTRVGRENHAVMDRFLLDHRRCTSAHTHVHRHARTAAPQGRAGGRRPAARGGGAGARGHVRRRCGGVGRQLARRNHRGAGQRAPRQLHAHRRPVGQAGAAEPARLRARRSGLRHL